MPVGDGFSFSATRGELHIGRTLYPYSIIPGGAESAAELRNAVATDPVVAAHYAGFDLVRAHVVRLVKVRSAYVSYRKDNAVFWTSKRLTLPAGETLITDGVYTSRTRCGNQVSDVPRAPVAPAGEPTAEALTTPLPIETLEPPVGLAVESPAAPEAPTWPGGAGQIIIPPVAPILIGNGRTPVGPILPLQPPTPTPEPATLLLTASGLTALWLASKRRK